VEFEAADAAEKAIAQINGKEVDGRNLVVNEARPRENNFGGGGGRNSFGAGRRY
jgi:RNA recognition motif-containing protein